MKSKILIILAIIMISCISAMALLSDAHTDLASVNNLETIKENIELEKEQETSLSNSGLPKSKLTLAILLLGGVGLAVFRRNNLM